MDHPPPFRDSAHHVLATIPHVTLSLWKQANCTSKLALAQQAEDIYHQEQITYNQFQSCTTEKTQALREEMSSHPTVLQTYNKQKWRVKRVAIDICRCRVHTDLQAQEKVRKEGFAADTAKYNQLNEEMMNVER